MPAVNARKDAGTNHIKSRRPPHSIRCPAGRLFVLLLTPLPLVEANAAFDPPICQAGDRVG